MSSFGDDLIQAMGEALAHAKGEGPAILHQPVDPREVRKRAKLMRAHFDDGPSEKQDIPMESLK